MGAKKGQRGWVSGKEAREKAIAAHRRQAIRDGKRGKIDAAEAARRIEAAESRRRRWW